MQQQKSQLWKIPRWSILESFETGKWFHEKLSLDQVLKELVQDLSQLLNYYKKPSEQSKNMVQSGQIKIQQVLHTISNNDEKEFVLKLAGYLELDQLISYQIFISFINLELSYLGEDYVITFDDKLLEKVKSHYINERQATTQLVCAIVRAADNAGHPFHDLAKETMPKLVNQEFMRFCLESYKTTVHQPMPQQVLTRPESAHVFAHQNLVEQKNFLELLILLHYYNSSSVAEIVSINQKLMDLSFGHVQPLKPHFDTNCYSVWERVCFLCSLLQIELLDFEKTLSQQTNVDQQLLMAHPQHVKTLDESVRSLAKKSQNPSEIGVVCLSWASFVLYCQIFAASSNLDFSSYDGSAQALFEFGYTDGLCFETLVKSLKQSWLIGDPNELAYKSIVKGFWSIVSMTHNLSSFPKRHVLVDFFCALFANEPQLCLQFWNQDYPVDELRNLLDMSQRAFPLDVTSFCRLVQSLVGDETTARYAMQYLTQLPTLSDYSRPHTMEETLEGTFVAVDHRIVANAHVFPFIIPSGAIVHPIDVEYVIVETQYSGWNLMLALLESYVNATISTNVQLHDGTLESTVAILSLINSVLKYGDDALRQEFFVHLNDCAIEDNPYGLTGDEMLTGLISEILSRCFSNRLQSTAIFVESMQTFSILVSSCPKSVWKNLRAQALLPKDAATVAFSAQPSFMQTLILPIEKSQASYKATIQFLGLVKALCVDAQRIHVVQDRPLEKSDTWNKLDMLLSSVSFILYEIFVNYDAWRYQNPNEKLEISKTILEILNQIMQDSTWTMACFEQKEESLARLQTHVVNCFLGEDARLLVTQVLGIIAIGSERLALRRTNALDPLLIEEPVLQALGFVKRLLVVIIHGGLPYSAFERSLLDRLGKDQEGKPTELLETVASYIKYEFNAELAMLSTEILSLLCLLSQKPDRPPLSLIGYFGERSLGLVSNFVNLVNEQSLMAAADEALQISILGFVSIVLETQTGLSAMFISGSNTKAIGNTEKEKQVSESSILSSVLGCVQKWESLKFKKPVLLASCLYLLNKLWETGQNHFTTIKKLREGKELWKCLKDIVSKEPDLPKSGIKTASYFRLTQSFALRILASEFHLGEQKDLQDTLLLLMPSKNTNLLKDALDPKLHNFSDTDTILHLLSQVKPEINLGHYRLLIWNDPFDRTKPYGKHYVYNVNLLHQKLNKAEFGGNALSICEAVLDNLQSVNQSWSESDCHLVFVRSFSFSVQLLLDKLKSAPALEKEILPLCNLLCDAISRHKTMAALHLAYLTEIGLLLSIAVSAYVKINNTLEDKLMLVNKIIGSLGLESYPDPERHQQEFGFHYHLFASVLILIQSIDEPDNRSLMRNAFKELVPIVCERLDALLIDSQKEMASSLAMLLAVLFQASRFAQYYSKEWIMIFDQLQTFPALLGFFARCNIQEPLNAQLTQSICEVLLSFSRVPSFCRLMFDSGLVAAFCDNTMTETLKEGQLQTFSNFQRSILHQVWCLMLSTVTNVLESLGSIDLVVENVVGFERLHRLQMQQALSIQNGPRLTLDELEEVERITGLYCSLVVVAIREDQVLADHLLTELMDPTLKLLFHYNFYLSNPVEFEKQLKQSKNDIGQHEERLLVIIRNLVFMLSMLVGVEKIIEKQVEVQSLSGFFVSWDQHDLSGTLFSLIRHCTKRIQTRFNKGNRDAILTAMMTISETSITLIVGHLLYWINFEDEGNSRKELVNDLGQTLSELSILLGDGLKMFKDDPQLLQSQSFLSFVHSLLTTVIACYAS
ncbi:hypothetical protein EDD86DRAFT_205325, partial [Gorgonomyces haynaldii]